MSNPIKPSLPFPGRSGQPLPPAAAPQSQGHRPVRPTPGLEEMTGVSFSDSLSLPMRPGPVNPAGPFTAPSGVSGGPILPPAMAGLHGAPPVTVTELDLSRQFLTMLALPADDRQTAELASALMTTTDQALSCLARLNQQMGRQTACVLLRLPVASQRDMLAMLAQALEGCSHAAIEVRIDEVFLLIPLHQTENQWQALMPGAAGPGTSMLAGLEQMLTVLHQMHVNSGMRRGEVDALSLNLLTLTILSERAQGKRSADTQVSSHRPTQRTMTKDPRLAGLNVTGGLLRLRMTSCPRRQPAAVFPGKSWRAAMHWGQS